MKSNKMKICNLLMCFCLVFALTGCTTSSHKAYTYSVETGDSVEIKLDTSDHYAITSDIPFVISRDGEVLSQGTFIHAEYYAQYEEAARTDEHAQILDSGTKDGSQYVFWSYNDSEYNYVILVEDSDTGIILANNVSEESARECFDRLTFSLE
ncbi:MAG: hypothetical protein K2N01_05035 [Lachnospiraceae bacterium]|nr:hypothetical protein [Lachnospiraceae bacterium]